MPTYHEVPVAHTSTQIVARRSAAPVLAVAPSNTKALRPSSIAAPRRGRPRGTGTGRRAGVVPRRAYAPPQTPRARAPSRRRPAAAASRRGTPTARKPAPTTTRRPVVPRRPRPAALSVTRGPPRYTDLRAAGVHRPHLETPSQRTKPFGPEPLTHRRELWSGRRDAAPLFRIAQERVFSAAVLGAARTDLSALT